MGVFVALLRAINVGGTGKLPMSELVRLCETAGFSDVRTYIQSGNVLFRSALAEAKIQVRLEKLLASKLGKAHAVHVRTRAELDAIITRNPFRDAAPNRVIVFFLERAPAKGALRDLVIPGREELRAAGREVFVHYPDGQGRSKLKLPFADAGTGRNLNTLQKLADLARELEDAS